MKTSFIVALLALGSLSIIPFSVEAKIITIHSHYKPSVHKVIQTYHKTAPNKTKLDNFSTKGNYNPYTGKKGTVNPYKW